MHSSLLKAAMLLVAGMATHVSMSPPNPPAAATEKAGKKDIFESLVLWITWATKTFTWLAVGMDAAATIFAALCANHYISSAYYGSTALGQLLCPTLDAADELTTINAAFTVGVVMVVLSALLRVACYRALGQLFTFEITIRPKHMLITTGPYGWVRHPSYVGLYGTLLGTTLIFLSHGSYIYQRGLHGPLSDIQHCFALWPQHIVAPAQLPDLAYCTAGALARTTQLERIIIGFMLLWITKVFFALSNVNKRLASEDGELQKTFGEEWDRYASEVRWRLIPGIV